MLFRFQSSGFVAVQRFGVAGLGSYGKAVKGCDHSFSNVGRSIRDASAALKEADERR
jgi:hypothetical protein